MGLIADIVSKGQRIEKSSFDFYFLSLENSERIIYGKYKQEDVRVDVSFGGKSKVSSELIWLFKSDEKFMSSIKRIIFDFSVLGEFVPSGFFNDFKGNLILFAGFEGKRVDVIISRGVVRGKLNEEFKKHCLDTGKEFFAIPPFEGGIDELTRLEKSAYTPNDEGGSMNDIDDFFGTPLRSEFSES